MNTFNALILSALALGGVLSSPPSKAAPNASHCLVKDKKDLSGDKKSGEMTMYTEWSNGKHKCVDYGVKVEGNGDCFVAISKNIWKQELCGKKILAKIGDKVFRFVVSDQCDGCKDGDLDLTDKAFTDITGESTGRFQFEWAFE